MGLTAADIVTGLRRHGITAHHAAPMPPTEARPSVMVVYLEGYLAQAQEARECVRAWPGVTGVTFAESSNAIMYVSSD
jgi:hypothetical protein